MTATPKTHVGTTPDIDRSPAFRTLFFPTSPADKGIVCRFPTTESKSSYINIQSHQDTPFKAKKNLPTPQIPIRSPSLSSRTSNAMQHLILTKIKFQKSLSSTLKHRSYCPIHRYPVPKTQVKGLDFPSDQNPFVIENFYRCPDR